MGDAGRRHLAYQPALDGVRALAVAAVVVFHGGVAAVSGGFLGVDAFFVLSGFLITSLLLAERAGDRPDRPGRVLGPPGPPPAAGPAAHAGRRRRGRALADAAGASSPRCGWDALAAVAYVANWRMAVREGDYFAATGAPSPLQHTWSLGIEEQFYLVWPLLVLAAIWLGPRLRRLLPVLARWTKRPRFPALFLACVAGAVASAVLAARAVPPRRRRPRLLRHRHPGGGPAGRLRSRGAARRPAAGEGRQAPGARHVRRRRRAGHRLPVGVRGRGSAVAVPRWADGGRTRRRGRDRARRAQPRLVDRRGPVPPAARLARADLVRRVSLALAPVRLADRRTHRADRVGAARGPARRDAGGGLRLVLPLSSSRSGGPGGHGGRRGCRPASPPPRSPSVRWWPSRRPSRRRCRPRRRSPWKRHSRRRHRRSSNRSRRPHRCRRSSRAGRAPGDKPRIAFMGDSVSWSLANYLPEQKQLEVFVRGVQGCGIARLPEIMYVGGAHTNYPGCDKWDAPVAAQHPHRRPGRGGDPARPLGADGPQARRPLAARGRSGVRRVPARPSWASRSTSPARAERTWCC